MKSFGFSSEQEIIIGKFGQSDFLKENFYFTGGTALSGFYLNHRYSDDLDFFSEKRFENQIILGIMERWSKEESFVFQSEFIEETYLFYLSFKNGARLKVDFTHYPYKQLKQKRRYRDIKVDSRFDIAANKLITIIQRTDVKDFVDLFFLLKKFTVWDLIAGAEVKFRQKVDPLILASDFLKIEGFDFLPKMIKPVALKNLKSFYRGLALRVAGRKVI